MAPLETSEGALSGPASNELLQLTVASRPQLNSGVARVGAAVVAV